MISTESRLAVLDALFQRGCLELRPQKPFIYASGLKGPIYCDNRRLLSFPDDRRLVAQCFAQIWRENVWQGHLVAGMATAGIAHAAFLAEQLDAPMVYVRSKPKGHGKGEQIEGACKEADRVVLLEDLVNQAASLADGVEGVRNAGLIVTDALAIVDYQMPVAKQKLEELGIRLHALVGFDDILQYGVETKRLDTEQEKIVRDWKSDPAKWSRQWGN